MNTNAYTKQIGERLLFFRTQAGLTIEDVAKLLSTSPARYTKLENGEYGEKR
jgi:transcriptional regulator with XRE-family HTH domain